MTGPELYAKALAHAQTAERRARDLPTLITDECEMAVMWASLAQVVTTAELIGAISVNGIPSHWLPLLRPQQKKAEVRS